MNQITLYVDENTQSKMRLRAKKAGLSISKWLTRLINKEINQNWPEEIKAMPGSWNDFPNLSDIRAGTGKDGSREEF